MPSYDTRTAAFVLGLTAEQFDNLLSRGTVGSVVPGSQGVDRRIGTETIVRIAIGSGLKELFGCSWRQALTLAQSLDEHGRVSAPDGFLTLTLDRGALRGNVLQQLMEASEYMVRPRRGRPHAR